MKKKLTLLTTAILLASMTACGQQATPADSKLQYIKNFGDFYENGVIYPKEWGVSYFLDFDTMERSPLCAVPNCTHQTAGCLANLLGSTPVLYNGCAYYFEYVADVRETKDGREFYMNSKLKKAFLDSSETQLVCEFTDANPRVGEGYLLDGNELYFIGYDPDPNENGYGTMSWSTAGGRDYICSINLDTGEYQNYGEVCYVEDEYPSADNTASAKILGFYNDKMYIGYSFAKEYSIEKAQKCDVDFTLYNFEFDLDSKELTESELPYAAWMDEDTYCYSEDGKNFTVIDQGQTYHLEGAVSAIDMPVFNGKVFGLHSWYDLSDQSEHSLGKYTYSEDAYWSCIAYYDGCYIFKNSNTFEKVSEEELKSL